MHLPLCSASGDADGFADTHHAPTVRKERRVESLPITNNPEEKNPVTYEGW
jgi:hypothetical protein